MDEKKANRDDDTNVLHLTTRYSTKDVGIKAICYVLFQFHTAITISVTTEIHDYDGYIEPVIMTSSRLLRARYYNELTVLMTFIKNIFHKFHGPIGFVADVIHKYQMVKSQQGYFTTFQL
jgi:hypothetical protein